MQDFYEFVKDEDKSEDKVEDKSEIVKLPYFSPEEKVEVADAESAKKPEDRKLNSALKVYNKNLNYTCLYCSKKFEKNCNLKKHMIIHNNPFKCAICGLRLKIETLFKSHVLLHERGRNLFYCADCDFKSAKVLTLKYH